MRDLVSVIVPVYNVAPYLPRCLKSLTEQTYRNIEIILVDDGSTDASGEICDLWAGRDDRIRVFHKPNGGLSDARNYGLERAAGAYVCFVDSDDWCSSRYIGIMLGALLETDSDLVECDYVCVGDDAAVIPEDQDRFDHQVYTDRDCVHKFLTNVFFVSVWNKLYRRELVVDAPFRLGVYHEDEYWTYRIFSRARRVCRLQYTGYYYYQRQGSIVRTMPSFKRLNDAFRAGRERIEFIEAQYPEFASIGYSKMMYTCMYLFSEAGRGVFPQQHAIRRELVSYFRVMLRKYLKRGQYRPEMWRFCFFCLFPKGYCRLNYGGES